MRQHSARTLSLSSSYKQSIHLGADLVILVVGQLNNLGWTLRGANSTALAEGLVYLRDIILVDLRHAIGTGLDADQAGGTPALFHLGNYAADGYIGPGKEGARSGRSSQCLGNAFANEFWAMGSTTEVNALR